MENAPLAVWSAAKRIPEKRFQGTPDTILALENSRR
jgi:hypothetical protein